jgi:cytochrome b561
MTPDTKAKLSPATVALHWIIGLVVIVLLAVGIYMAKNEVHALYPWHMSIGQLIFFFALAQVILRLKKGWPEPVQQYSRAERWLARAVHYLLLLGVLLMPIFGFTMAAMSGNGVFFFGVELVAPNPDPANPGEVIALNGSIAKLAHEAHEYLGFTLVVAVLLHIAGAAKHHRIDKDGTLRRMLGKRV